LEGMPGNRILTVLYRCKHSVGVIWDVGEKAGRILNFVIRRDKEFNS
jgi:hypothetical protein